jgi:apolipoprotein N-acyltransferase
MQNNKIVETDFFAPIIFGIILALPFLFAGFWWLAWCGLIPLLILIERSPSYKKTMSICFAYGFSFYVASLYWLYYTSLIGLIIVAAYCSLYFVLFGFILKAAIEKKRPSTLVYIIFASCLWVACEFIRSHLFTGFGWNQLGYSQFEKIKIIQIADFSGVYGVTFTVVYINASLKDIAVNLKNLLLYKRKIVIKETAIALSCLIIILLSYAYGDIKLNEKLSDRTMKVSVIQGNIAQHKKWENFYKDMIMDKYIRLSSMAAIDRPDLIVWPETSLPGYLEEYDLYKEVSDFAKDVRTPVLIGAPRMQTYNQGYYNSAVLFSKEGEMIDFYDKIHLVPFGEYIPFRKVMGFLYRYYDIAEFSPGDIYTIFKVDGYNLSVLICFEDAFEGLVRNFVRRGADFMINITNDAWFYESAEPRQHLSASVLRAVENNKSFIRAANTGISGFIDPYGRIISKVKKGKKDVCVSGFSTAEVPLSENMSIYTRLGNVFVLSCIVFILSYLFKPSRK